MKIILLLFSVAFLPLCTLVTCTTNTPNQLLLPVYDIEGNPLNKNSRYFLISFKGQDRDEGVTLANLGNEKENTCPTAVVQSLDYGKGVYIIPNDTKSGIIIEKSTVNIKFYLDSPNCSNFTMWKVDNFPESVELYNISTGQQLVDPRNNQFQIELIGGSTYKIVFCPFKVIFPCANVGITQENGYNRLVLAEDALEVVFIPDSKIGKAIM